MMSKNMAHPKDTWAQTSIKNLLLIALMTIISGVGCYFLWLVIWAFSPTLH